MKLIYTKEFNGYPVIDSNGPLVYRILIGNEMVLNGFLSQNKDIVVMFFVLKFPSGYLGPVDIISKFFDSLRVRINSNLRRRTEKRGRKIYTDIGYIWAKELGKKGGWHYHVAIMFDRSVYFCFGKFTSDNDNIYNRIKSSWASAMGVPASYASGLIFVVENSVHEINVSSPSFNEDYEKVLYRLSYVAKLKDKPYGSNTRLRFYGTSKK